MSISAINSTPSLGLSDAQTSESVYFHQTDAEKEKTFPVENEKHTAKDHISVSEEARAEKEKAEIEDLKRVEQQVEQHEAAHQAAAGQYFRGKSYTYKIGPDGKRYIVAGEVQVDTSAIPGNPKATIAKMDRIRSAALAPGDPSPQDIKVAEAASRAKAEAEQEESSQIAVQMKLPKSGISENKTILLSVKQKSAGSSDTMSSNDQSGTEATSAQFNMSISVPISSLFGSARLGSNEGRYIDTTV